MGLTVQFASIPTTAAEWNRFFRGLTVSPDRDTVSTDALEDGSVTDEKLRNSVGCSVIGQSANAVGDPGDIQAEESEFLRRKNNTLGFGQLYETVTKSSSFTAEINKFYLVDASSGDVVVTMPTAVDGAIVSVKKVNSNTGNVILSGNIDGYSSVTLNMQYMSYTMIGNSSQWYV